MNNYNLRKKNIDLLRGYTVSELKSILKNTNKQITKINKDMDTPLSTGMTPRETGWPEMEKLILAHQEQSDLIRFVLKEREVKNQPRGKKYNTGDIKITKSQIKALLYADDHSLLAANAVRQGHMKVSSIVKQYQNEIKQYAGILKILSDNGHYLGESLSYSEAILKHIKEAIESVAYEKGVLV